MTLFNLKTIRAKLILLFTVFFLLPFVLFGSIWYQRSTELIEENAIASAQKSIGQANTYLNYYFDDIERRTLPYITHPLIQAFMKITPEDTYQRYAITTQIQSQVINQIINGKKEIYGLSIISGNGVVASNLAETMDGLTNRDFNQLEPKGDRKTKFNTIHWESGIPLLTISRKFSDTSTYRTDGLMFIDLRLNELSALISNIGSGQAGFTWISDGEGGILLHPDQSKIGQAVPDWYKNQIQNKERGSLIAEDSGVSKLIVFERTPSTGWTLVSEVPLAELTGDLFALRNVTIVILSAVTLISLLVLGGFTLNLTNALSHLGRLMKRAGSGEMFVRAHVRHGRQDETSELYESFNHMVEKLQRLIEEIHASELRKKELIIKQRETMLKAMQAQINPHFLYNTLEVINSYAILENVMPISRMATSLAALFRYSITSGDTKVTLYEEMKHIETYLDIQKERFEHLTVELQVAWNELPNVRALRLTLQPLVENVFRHAYEKHERYPDYIGIQGEAGETGYRLIVMDKGEGMPPAVMERLNRSFQSVSEEGDPLPENEQDDASRSGRMGLWNVHQRLRLSFGGGYGLHILKSDEEGTWIEVYLPIVTGGKLDA
ncbi:cache domain-containing sensor histidine kinase [Paenibacillus hamazuiensis]|uniref:cache domain-containing sensor histidine kinase n=1 Tax=Paenibacillus hamazuiensis TaxID=2936508 RepID=UPI00200BDD79|nr:sensor histidine kinase [Paenibacillus hamazuiensis]